jgi:hypothetical protein
MPNVLYALLIARKAASSRTPEVRRRLTFIFAKAVASVLRSAAGRQSPWKRRSNG